MAGMGMAQREERGAKTLSREQRYLSILKKVSRLTSLVFDPQEVMETIVSGLPGLLELDACTIRLLDPSTATFVLGAAHGVSLDYLSREQIDSEETLAMVRAGNPVCSDHVDEEPFQPFREAAGREGIKSVLTLPILFQGELTGILRLLSRRQRSFTGTEISFAMNLAEQVGIAIANGRMFRDMEAQLTFIREIQEISTLVNSTLDLEVLLRNVVERVVLTMAVKGCTLRLLNPESRLLELAASFGVSASYLKRGEVENEANIRMVLAGEPVAIYDVRNDPRIDYHLQMAEEGIVSLLAVPLKVHGEIIGVMRILSDAPRVFTSTEVRFAATLAEVAGTAIRNARNYQQINQLLGRLREHETFLTEIINSLQHQLLVLDRQRRVVLANRVFLQASGKNEAEVLGMSYHDLCQADESGSCPVDQILKGERMQPFVREYRGEDQARWLERTASPIVDAAGDIAYVIEVIRDITSAHLLEEEKLERGKLQAIVELAGTVAHEINTPLFAALGTAQLLTEEAAAADLGEELAVIIRNLQQIGELTGKMTGMTGYSRQNYIGERTILDLNEADTEARAAGKGGAEN